MEKDTIITAVVVGILVFIRDWIKDYRAKIAAKKVAQGNGHNGFGDDLKTSGKIYDELVDMLFAYDAIRSYIKQFHNGSAFYSGQKIQRLTVSHEKCRPGIGKIKQDHDGILIPLEVHDIFTQMGLDNRQYYYCENQDLIRDSKPELWQWMEIYKVKSILYFKISDTKTGEPIGLLGLNFNHRNALNSSQIKEIEKRKRRFESIFDKL